MKTNHDLVVGEEYIFTAIESALRRVYINDVYEGGILDGTRVKITEIRGRQVWVMVVGHYPDPIPYTFRNYYWPPECFNRPDGQEPPKIVKRNVLNYWPALKEKNG